MVSANIIEPSGKILLKNINKNATPDLNEWKAVSTSVYGCYQIPYDPVLKHDHIYFYNTKYKYTTTDQKPKWVETYWNGGMFNMGRINNISASTEYQMVHLLTPDTINNAKYTWPGIKYGNVNNGTVYHSPYSGATAYIKQPMVYDVTELYSVLRINGTVSNYDGLKTWCKNNLVYHEYGDIYDITSLVSNSVTDKVVFSSDNILSDFVETDGMRYYGANSAFRTDNYFEKGIFASVYNNKGSSNGVINIGRVVDSNSPFYPEHKVVLNVTTKGATSDNCTPSLGGIYCTWVGEANKRVVEKVVAKVPVGYKIICNNNLLGTGGGIDYLSSSYEGTGKYEEYTWFYKIGTANFTTSNCGGFISIEPSKVNTCPDSANVSWNIAYMGFCDVTGKEYLKNYNVLAKKEIIDGNNFYSYSIDSQNLFPNGDGSDTTATLPSKYQWDKNNVAGKAKASFMQPIDKTQAQNAVPISHMIPIDPTSRYRLSLWVKTKGDMSNYLFAIKYRTAEGKLIEANNLSYVLGTKTQLSKDLAIGDTQVQVVSNSNWVIKNYSYLGFRKSIYYSGYCDATGYTNYRTGEDSVSGSSFYSTIASTGVVTGTSGSNIILLNRPYSGTKNVPSGTTIVEGYSEMQYYYPFSKSDLPKDNTWKYLSKEFGIDGCTWDGAGGGWSSIPMTARYLEIVPTLYKNDGTAPIYYSDVRLEEIGKGNMGKHETKVQLKRVVESERTRMDDKIIVYTTTDGKPIVPYKSDSINAKMILNEYNNGIGYMVFDSTITTIGTYAFCGVDTLKSILIPVSVTTIGELAFGSCSDLYKIVISSSIASIGDYAFEGAGSTLRDITIQATTPPTTGADPFVGLSSDATIKVPLASLSTYKAANVWKDHSSVIIGYNGYIY